ncbi:MAG: sigma-70 family RNA polymerase sigma factor [Chloroflexi bacterium]|nr:sigma-70 family RNA polymerase sigma factor [Chloroflexota bacterium]
MCIDGAHHPGRFLREGRLTRTDQEIVQACLSGDANAYAVLVERYGGRVYNIALRITGDGDSANDCSQEAFIRAYRALHQYDPTLPFGPWLYRITTNASLNHVRRWGAHEVTVDELPDSPEALETGPEQSVVRREELDEVLAALAELQPAYRAALTLRHMQQLSYQEVADALDLPMGTVKTHLHRARAALKARLAARGKERH